MTTKILITSLLIAALFAAPAHAQDPASEIAELRLLVAEIRSDYETRISDLEQRLARAERLARNADRDASEAYEIAEQTAIEQTSGSSSPNAFNAAIGLVLDGRYASVDNGWEQIPGFQPAGEIGTGDSGFSPGESEINFQANVDSKFFGNFTLGIADEAGELEVELEEAWFQTTGLSNGFTLTGGRFFSEAGYLNEFHRHADDFTDRPLPYQALFGGQYKVDGVQARWVAPVATFVELGGEASWGADFPATANATSSASAWTLFANVGGDIGDSNSWLLGVSWITADVEDRETLDEDDPTAPPESFTGDSDTLGVDIVWKWAPGGNPANRYVKVQAEYFGRNENGTYTDVPYDGDQYGWYLQGVWQFAPTWRVGLRHDLVNAQSGPLLIGTAVEDPGRSSTRGSAMIDWSPSEFSRLRLQYTNDRVLAESDNQLFLQYIMSIGAHAAHEY